MFPFTAQFSTIPRHQSGESERKALTDVFTAAGDKRGGGGGGGGDGGGFPDDVVGGLTACSATSLLDYDLWIMSAFTERKKGKRSDF